MKYSAFEQAAVEASTGVKEIDAEMERLKAKRELLESLLHQLLSVLPKKGEAGPSDGGSFGGLTESEPSAREQWGSFVSASAAEAPVEQPVLADAQAEEKPASFRKGDWPNFSSNDSRGIRERLDCAVPARA